MTLSQDVMVDQETSIVYQSAFASTRIGARNSILTYNISIVVALTLRIDPLATGTRWFVILGPSVLVVTAFTNE